MIYYYYWYSIAVFSSAVLWLHCVFFNDVFKFSFLSVICKRLLRQRIAKDTSVKRQILVAFLEDLPENHENVQQIWSLIHTNSVQACNMNMANILCRLQSHLSSHPCICCDVESKQNANSGDLRTLDSIKTSLQKLRNAEF